MAVVERARMLGAYMQAGNQALARDARTVMLQTAIDLSEGYDTKRAEFTEFSVIF